MLGLNLSTRSGWAAARRHTYMDRTAQRSSSRVTHHPPAYNTPLTDSDIRFAFLQPLARPLARQRQQQQFVVWWEICSHKLIFKVNYTKNCQEKGHRPLQFGWHRSLTFSNYICNFSLYHTCYIFIPTAFRAPISMGACFYDFGHGCGFYSASCSAFRAVSITSRQLTEPFAAAGTQCASQPASQSISRQPLQQ